MKKNSALPQWIGFLLPAAMAGGLIYYLAKNVGMSLNSRPDSSLSGLEQILMIMLGMVTMVALTALYALVARWLPGSVAYGSFANEMQNKRKPKEAGLKERNDNSAWELKANRLVGADNTLALAKLRIDLLQSLRHLAFSRNVEFQHDSLNAVEIANHLERQGIIPADWGKVLKKITFLCEAAIRNGELDNETALHIVWEGDHLLKLLNELQENIGERVP